ncbi:zinc-binding protein A33-like [Gadus macrocephalus]|uniref:zinc-binding protein A33-like n=1 Tax=Gadus macrocephalus TaxID=80720 RepID=UPI0028CBBEAA|nr:zinc-binding protein A33-like [Gadus macrocephalus]XP_059898596.1 zinc-binding protein A33-like [Gadus macrocephalus]
MAEAPTDPSLDIFSEQELTCSICLDVFTDPVSTPCGHNFCQACIGGYWASSRVCSCPLCKRQFDERPLLNINRVFALIADKYKHSRYGTPLQKGLPTAAGRHEEQAGTCAYAATNPFAPPDPGALVNCDICTGVKRAAVSSCLVCTAAYCDEHVQPHLTSAFYASHSLLDPQEALRGRTCAEHKHLLEVYCRTCQSCVCGICVLGEHRTHQTVSVQTERLHKQKLLSRSELEIVNRIEGKNLRLMGLKQQLHVVTNYANGEQAEVEQLLSELSESMESIRALLLGRMQTKRDAVVTHGEGLVSRLEAELGQLVERRALMDTQATSQDHIRFLQNFDQTMAPLAAASDPQAEAESKLSLHFNLTDIKSALTDVRERMDEIRTGNTRSRGSLGSISSGERDMSDGMSSYRGSNSSLRASQWSLKDVKKIKAGAGLRKILPYMEDVTLNPVTAYPFLVLSEDRKQVKRGEKLQFYRNSQQRFDIWSCILAKEGYDTGRHYWEVSVGDGKDWKLGVVSESAQRKGLFDMSPSSGYYALWWSGSQLRALTTPPLMKVKISSKLRKVGVFLSLEEGQVSFYNTKTGSELYTFRGSEFTERMYPLLGTGDKEVPLVLLTVQ